MMHDVRKARLEDIKSIHAMLLAASSNGLLLPRSLSQLYKHCRDFYVVETKEHAVAGCCALAVIWDDCAEIRSLIVQESLRGQGIGELLVRTCLEEARELQVPRVFTLTYQTKFFSRLGFTEVSKDSLPQKIWADCIHCSKFPDCDEIAMDLIL